MIEQNAQNFEHKELEADMRRLSEEILGKRNLPEYKDFSNKEIIKESIRPIIKSDLELSKPENKTANEETEKSFLPDYALELPIEKKLEVEKLIDEVFHKGLKVIEGLKNHNYSPNVVDAFHDALAGKLSIELERRKLI